MLGTNTKMISYIVLVTVLLEQTVQAQDCENKQAGFIYPRLFVLRSNGTLNLVQKKAQLLRALGDCRNSLEEFSSDMINYFESSYGVDLSAARGNVNERFENQLLSIRPVSTNLGGDNDMLLVETFYGFAKSRNDPMIYIGWDLAVKTPSRGAQGALEPGQYVAYGNIRFKVHSREFCVLVKGRPSSPPNNGQGLVPINALLYNEFWGEGFARGTAELIGDIMQQYIIMIFPS